MPGEVVATKELIAMAAQFGISGLVLVLWWLGDRQHQKTMQMLQQTLAQHHEYMVEQRQMYKDNVVLVQAYHGLCGQQQDLTIMAVQGLTKMSEQIENNEFCPVVTRKIQVTGEGGGK